ncbi:MAG TPA: hypothetical protein VGU61_03000 [Noviherbaspirillum sp.]|uniref:hypothetical protein n=1 Tax=Noviherbaspirillum sp. TaxID=1926288 RepID=UPI002DDCA1B9|nr:hypothetical protein [Noviherbaspirillum sp.]HEV2609213.1 hypothetical protein [Noviherbaspirillum sp.]
MEQIVSMLYGLSGIAATVLYIPQILKYRRDPVACKSISLICWSGWAVLAAITVLYALYVVRNQLFAVVAAMNFGAQLAVIFYGLKARRAGKASSTRSPAATDRGAGYQKG